nr:MAG TPA: hypothetical protein [Caudoviricetes sp.]
MIYVRNDINQGFFLSLIHQKRSCKNQKIYSNFYSPF